MYPVSGVSDLPGLYPPKVQHIVLLLGIALFGILVWIEPVIRLQLLAVAFATGAAVYLLGKA